MSSRSPLTSICPTISTWRAEVLIILGVDPGLSNTGWGVVSFDGKDYRPVSYGVIKTPSTAPQEKRIYTIAEDLG
ncbi:MAG: crossover junction endodeoxyribonuclease RuvC, partial [Candidatus Ornithospirochaeta sp.]